MFHPTRVRAIFSTHLRRQTAAPSSGGKMDPKTQNNALLAAVAAVTVLGGSYYMGYWDTDKAKDKAKGKYDYFGLRRGWILMIAVQDAASSVKKE
ncbi:hypothetical protein MVEN_00756300 [Mycena venus]|uniref:Uncharacterized protein n=1 Tax=Mycena venus TaxID=2733690 RepID=A0A8H6YFK8_9AGAR|nr:hypothetical protein MVEN_00756300 [Mycena venus]